VFLQAGRELAVAEQGTVTWYAFKISDTRYGTFDTFETDEARQAHLNGEIPAALGQVAPDLLASPPETQFLRSQAEAIWLATLHRGLARRHPGLRPGRDRACH
jgi:hypothetical protein